MSELISFIVGILGIIFFFMIFSRLGRTADATEKTVAYLKDMDKRIARIEKKLEAEALEVSLDSKTANGKTVGIEPQKQKIEWTKGR